MIALFESLLRLCMLIVPQRKLGSSSTRGPGPQLALGNNGLSSI